MKEKQIIAAYEAGLERAAKQLTGLTYDQNLRKLDHVANLCKMKSRNPNSMTDEQFVSEIIGAVQL